jgi:hypothetical protein
MRRQLKYSVHYKPQNSERRAGAIVRFTQFRWLFNKTIFEVLLLVSIVATIVWLITQQAYFQVNDITITGLDSYASVQAQQTIESYFKISKFGLPHHAYIGLSVLELQKELQKKIALDSIAIEKKFPHTLRIHATETPMKIHVHMLNGDALVSADGLLVRWYPAGGIEPATIAGPLIITNVPGAFQSPLSPVLSQREQEIVAAIHMHGLLMGNEKLLAVEFMVNDPERIILAYGQGTHVIITGLADVAVQLKKAIISVESVGPGKQIDVRFGDKIFISSSTHSTEATSTPQGIR